MSEPRLKNRLASVLRAWEALDYDAALEGVESLLDAMPGNPHLHVLWASLVQLQDDPKNSLVDAKHALERAVDLDRDSPAAAIELGHFLDNVEDDPAAAAKAYAEGAALARRLLIDGLIGQAKAYRQLGQRKKFLECLSEVLYLVRFEPERQQNRPTSLLKEPFANQIQELIASAADR